MSSATSRARSSPYAAIALIHHPIATENPADSTATIAASRTAPAANPSPPAKPTNIPTPTAHDPHTAARRPGLRIHTSG